VSNRLKRFAIVSLGGVVLAAAVLVLFYRHLAVGTLRKNYDTYNSALAQILLNSLRPYHISELLAFYGDAATLDSPLPKEIQEFERQVTDNVESLPIFSLTLYDEDGVVVYSTTEEGVGGSRAPSEGVQLALDGRVGGGLALHDFMEVIGAHGIDSGLGYYASYIPIRESPDGAVIGVLEARSDVTDLIVKMRNVGNLIILGVVLILGSFYLLLFLFYFRLDQALRVEERERERYLAQVEETNELLEERVAERTAALEASREFLQSVIDGIADPVRVIDSQSRVRSVNVASQKLIQGEGVDEVAAPNHDGTEDAALDQSVDFEPLASVLASGVSERVTHTRSRPDGTKWVAEVTTSPLCDRNGQMLGVVQSEHDVTPLVSAMNQLRESEERLRAVMNQVVDGILTVNRQGKIETVNRAMEMLFGFDSNVLCGKAFADLIPSIATEEGVLSLDDLPPSREFSMGGGAREVMGVRRDGAAFPVDLWVGKLILGEGEKFIIVVRDISERKASEKEIAQTRRQYFHQEKMAAIGQLAAGILHEVGNPIAAISGSIQMLRSQFQTAEGADGQVTLDDEFFASLQMVEEQTERLARITREIAGVSSPRPMERELLDLNALIESATNLLRYDRRWKRVALRLELDHGLPAIFAVADQLTQIFMNLLINAADAGETRSIGHPEIAIRTGLEDGRMHVVVEDNCGGMDEKTLRHARDAFFTTKPAGSGTGLGLSLCDSLITAHRGELRVESLSGVGTTVHVYLPIEDE